MAGSYEEMGVALAVHLEQLADQVQAIVGKRPATVVLPDPKLGKFALWLEPAEKSTKAGDTFDTDENVVPINVAVSVPFDMQRNNPLLFWKLCDLLNKQFTDEMPDDPVLRHTRTRGISPERDVDGGTTLLVARMRLDVPIYTRF